MARAARLLDSPDYSVACAATVRNLIVPMVEGGCYHVYPHERDNQCAYDISPMVLGLEDLYLFSGAANVRDLALTCAGWLHGNNPAAAVLYDPLTGRCADGISNGAVNSNCGAESAIEAGFIHLAQSRL